MIEPASYRSSNGRTTVPLHLEPWGTVFVVFRRRGLGSVPDPAGGRREPWPRWKVPGSSASSRTAGRRPRSRSTAGLVDDSSDEGVKYFSGTATYTRTLDAPASWFKLGTRLWIDLGDVKNLAEVSVNGKPLGIVWKTPFRVDVTGALKPGPNQLTIRVTNVWVNRMIGDRQSETAKHYTLTVPTFYKASSPLLGFGLARTRYGWLQTGTAPTG